MAIPEADRPDPLDLTGRDIFHFRVFEPLGAGGMGVVYRGQDTRLRRSVALKFLLPHYSLDATAKSRFLREARAAAALDHPNLCTIYDVRESEDGWLFLAMALYSGQTLKARLTSEGPLPVAQALAITSQIARGLSCVHDAGIVHRDLKPGNVMVLADGTVKILDFGLAKALDESTTETDTRFGTVAYMAPEQVRGETVDSRADVWAIGVVLYEMLTGHKPFGGEHQMTIAHAILNEEPVAPGMLRDGLPRAVEQLVLRLLQKDPGTRYESVDQLLADLVAIGPLEERATRTRTRRLRPRLRRLTKRGWVMTLGAVLLTGGAGYAAIVLQRGAARGPGSGATRPVSWFELSLPDAEGLAPEDVYRIAISPSGDRVAYVGPAEQGVQLWLRKRDQLHATPLAGTQGAVIPFFSPDGVRLGFVTPSHGFVHTAVKVVSLGGGPPQMVTDSLVQFGGAAWGYDGYIYFDANLAGDGIARAPESGGLPEPITITDTASGELWHEQPDPLPNGKGVLFGIARSDMSQHDIGVVDLASRKHRVLIRGVAPRYAASGHLVYTTVDGTLMAAPFDQDRLALAGKAVPLAEGVLVKGGELADLAISANGTLIYAAGPSTNGRMEVVWVTRDGHSTPIDTTWRGDFSSLALSPNGAELAISASEGGHTDIWIKRLGEGRLAKMTFEGDNNERPAWTPDGQAVTFISSRRSGSLVNPDLYLARADGSALPRQVRDGAVQEAQYSRDGKWLVYRTGSDLFAVRTDGDSRPIPLVATSFAEATPTLSPDGRWLAYSSDESGRREVYVRPFPNTGSAKWQVSTGGAAEPLWSRNGRELFYTTYRNTLEAVAILPAATFAVGKPQVLFSTVGYEGYWMQRTYDVSPDGRRFIMIKSAPKSAGKLVVVENFLEVLKSRVKR